MSHLIRKSVFDLERVFFPVIGKNVTLHRQPCGILAKVLLHGYPQSKVYELNNFASCLLLFCTGKNSIQNIFSKIKNRYHSESFDVIESAKNFFWDAFSKGILVLTDKSIERKLKVSGSSKYYSPSHFSVEVTDACNLNCKHCYRDSDSGRKNRLPTPKLLEILKDMSEHGVLSVELTGGEPTFHPDIREIVKYCCEYFSTVGILSNGWFIDEEFGKLLSKFKNKLFVQVDLDGHIPAVHDTLRGVRGSFLKALRSIHVLVKNHVKVRAVMNVYPGNYKFIKQTFLLAKELGANWFGLAPLMPVGRGNQILQLDKDQIEIMISLAEEFSKHHPDFFFVSTEMEKRIKGEIDNCGAGSRSMVLGPTGLVRPCLILGENYFSFGDLTKMSYPEFLKTPPISYFYHLKAPNHITCKECDFYISCAGCFIGPVIIMEKMYREGVLHHCQWEKINNFLAKLYSTTQPQITR